MPVTCLLNHFFLSLVGILLIITFIHFIWLLPGITFNEKWNTDNALATEITVEDQLVKGLKLSFDTQFVPQTGLVI